ncbi:MAG TPA: Fmu (Sun) domain protein, partial [Chitinophagaceae bacterium]
IIADAWPCLRNGGILIYSTCSYSIEENESIIRWMTGEFGCAIQPLVIDPAWNIVQTEAGCRFWPHLTEGEGLFMACVRKPGEVFPESSTRKTTRAVERPSHRVSQAVTRVVSLHGDDLIGDEKDLKAVAAGLLAELPRLSASLRITHTGTPVGEWIRDRLIPAHALALSAGLQTEYPSLEVSYADAILYLQKKELPLPIKAKGWHRLTFKGHSLGWVNVLANRINNYYPKELRILKERP